MLLAFLEQLSNREQAKPQILREPGSWLAKKVSADLIVGEAFLQKHLHPAPRSLLTSFRDMGLGSESPRPQIRERQREDAFCRFNPADSIGGRRFLQSRPRLRVRSKDPERFSRDRQKLISVVNRNVVAADDLDPLPTPES